jgi:hypothetical protein
MARKEAPRIYIEWRMFACLILFDEHRLIAYPATRAVEEGLARVAELLATP